MTSDLRAERIDRITDLIGRHTVDVCAMAFCVKTGALDPDEFENRVRARCVRTVTALLACLHEAGPP